MRAHQLLAKATTPDKRTLFVGPGATKFFAVARCAPSSFASETLLSREHDGQTFDVIVLSGVTDLLDDDAVRQWALRSLDLLAVGGRLVVDIRPLWLDMSWTGFDLGTLYDHLQPSRVLDPLSILDCLRAAGFCSVRDVRHWTSNHVAKVLVPGPRSDRRVETSHLVYAG
jgi:hypothetical protein